MDSILVIRYSALGDVVLATSVLDPLRERFPGARIEWVTAPAYAPLLEGLPGVAAVHRMEHGGIRAAARLGRSLRGRFDLAVDLQNKVKSAVVARSAAPRRIVFRRRTARQAALALVGLDRPRTGSHATELYADALRPVGITRPGKMQVHLSAQARSDATAALAGAAHPRVAIAPGASQATKRWPAERFAEVARSVAAAGASVVLAGGPSDRPALDAFARACRVPVAADLTALPVGALAAALAEVELLVACDSGPVHLASAVGTPTLAIFGPTSAERWGPAAPGRVISLSLACAPCSNHGGARCPERHHRCMLDLEAGAVTAAALEMIAAATR